MGYLLVGFIVAVAGCLLLTGIGTGEIGQVSGMIPLLGIGLVVVFVLSGLVRSGGSGGQSSQDVIEDPADEFDPEQVYPGRQKGVVILGTKKGRLFIVAKAGNEMAFQEVDRHGNVIGHAVRSNPNVWKFGRTPDKDLAEYLKRKVEGG